MPVGKSPPLQPQKPPRTFSATPIIFVLAIIGTIAGVCLFPDEIMRAIEQGGKKLGNAPAAAILQPERTVGDLVQHFRNAGVKGEFYRMVLGPSGAKEGGGFHGDKISVWIYRFDDVALAESLVKSGMQDMKCYRNGTFLMAVDKGGDRMLPLFEKF